MLLLIAGFGTILQTLLNGIEITDYSGVTRVMLHNLITILGNKGILSQYDVDYIRYYGMEDIKNKGE